MDAIQIGWSSKTITPQKPVALAGQFYERITDQVRDPLFATALALESRGEQSVLVSCDLISIEKPLANGVRELVRQRIPGLDPERIILAATHTHSAPVIAESKRFPNLGYRKDHEHVLTPEQYSGYAAGQIAEAVKEAWEGRTAGGVSWEMGYAVLGFNRRTVYDDRTAVMYGQVNSVHYRGFGGPEDPRVEMLFTWNANRELTGILLNAACTAQIAESTSRITADYFGELRLRIAERWGSGVHVLGIIGAAGDLAPRDTLRKHHRTYEPDKEMRQAASTLMRTIEDALETAKETIDSSPFFKHSVRVIDLPLRKVEKTEVESAREQRRIFQEQLDRQEDKAAFFSTFDFKRQSDIFNCYAVLQRYEELQKQAYYPVELHVLRIGDIALATNPFELFTEYGLQMKARSAARQTFIAQLSCDCGGYLPTAEAVATGGYSTQIFSGYVGPDGGRMLVDYTVQAIQGLWED